MKNSEIKSLVNEGWIHTRILFQLVGSPKEHVEKTLKDYIITLNSDDSIKVAKEDYGKAEKEGNMYSAIAEIDLIVKEFDILTRICFDYMPASIEIIDPKEIVLKRKDLKNYSNDLLAKLHEVSTITREVRAQNDVLVKNTVQIVRNALLYGAKQGHTVKEISAHLGMNQKDIKPFLDTLIKEGKLSVKNDKMKIAGDKKSKK